MHKKSKYLITILFTAILLMIIKGTSTEAYVGSIFSYTYEGQTLTYQVLKEPTVTENGTTQVIYSNEVNKSIKGKVIIPATVTNQKMTYDVIRIDHDAFANAKGITDITLPDTINTIGSSAFYNCINLTEINIPQGVTRIEEETFRGCSSLLKISLPNQLNYIGSNAFYECVKLQNIVIPKSVNYIGAGAFEGCRSFTSIIIPEGITSIADNLFRDCIKLSSVSIPESVEKIGTRAFYNCSSLDGIKLPNGLTSIDEYAFYDCDSLTSIKIPYGVTAIKDYTFFGCTNLEEIIFQGKITSIGNYAFLNCKSLNSIELPEGLTSIGAGAFYLCENLRPFIIPKSVTMIGQGEFPYAGVLVYKNSFAETYFKENHPEYYQLVAVPLEEMSFTEDVVNIGVNESVQLKLSFYPTDSTEIKDSISWSSSDTSVATVDSFGEVRGLKAGEADVTAVMGKYSVTSHIIVGGENVNPTAISFSDSNITLNKGESVRLPLAFTPENTTNRKVTWSSSDSSIVTVDNGRIYAKNQGSAIIKAQAGSLTAEITIAVKIPLQEVSSNYSNITMIKGETKKVAISYYPLDTTDDLTTTWKSSDEGVATVANGVIKAIKPGKTVITVTVGSITKSIPVTVQIPLESLSLTQKEITMTAGQTKELPLLVVPMDTTEPITITSSDKTVAKVSDGTITALKRGTATITIVSGSYNLSLKVTVKTDIESIALNKNSLTLNLGKSEALTVSFKPAKIQDNKTVTWKSSNTSVATVDKNGKIKTVGIGTATITATAGGDKKASAKVTVKLAVPASFKVVSSGYNSIKLTWQGVSGASGYEVYRSTTKTGTYKKLKDTTAKALSNTGLTAGTTYYYKVRAYKLQGTKKVYSSFTSIIGAKPIPSTPSNVKLIKPKAGTANFTWNKVNGASGYEIYRTSSKSQPFKLVKSTTSLHFINYGLTKGKTYSYKVRAYKIVGKKKVYSNFSDVFSVKM